MTAEQTQRYGLMVVFAIEAIVLSLSMCFPTQEMLQVASSITLFAFPAMIYAFYGQNPMERLSMKERIAVRQWFFLFLFAMLMIPAGNFLTELNMMLGLPSSMAELEIELRSNHAAMELMIADLLSGIGIGGLAIALFSMAIVPAVTEELFFRAFLQGWLMKKVNIHLTIVVVSVVFSLLHFDFYGFIPRFVISVMYGYVFYYTRSVWGVMALHFVNNAIYVVVTFVMCNCDGFDHIVEIGEGMSVMLIGALATVVMCSMLRLIKR